MWMPVAGHRGGASRDDELLTVAGITRFLVGSAAKRKQLLHNVLYA